MSSKGQREDRQTYLEQREKYYRKMDDERLDKEWVARHERSIEFDEMRVLRSLVREMFAPDQILTWPVYFLVLDGRHPSAAARLLFRALA